MNDLHQQAAAPGCDGASDGASAAAERAAKVAEAAYFRAQQRGFAPGHAVEDWLEAEKHVAHLLLSVAA